MSALLDPLQRVFDACYGSVPREPKPSSVRPILVGHRGVCGHPSLRENTLEAFELAVSLGAALEFDLHMTADGRVVVHHDPDFCRGEGERPALAELPLEALRKAAPYIPTLEEVLDTFGHCVPHLFLEIKLYQPRCSVGRILGLVREEVERRGLGDRCTLLSLDEQLLDAARELWPELPKVYVYTSISSEAAVSYVRKHGDTGIAGWYFSFPEKVRPFLRERNLFEGVGYIDYPSTSVALANRGFRYHFSNRVDRLRS